MTLAESTRMHILTTCMLHKWNIAAACRSLGIVSKTLYNRLHEYEADGFVVHEGKRWRATRAGMELARVVSDGARGAGGTTGGGGKVMSERPRKTKLTIDPAPPPASPTLPPPPPAVAAAHSIRRVALAEQILLDALRVSWTMGTTTAESVFGSPETLAKFAVRAADGLIAALAKPPEANETKGSKQ